MDDRIALRELAEKLMFIGPFRHSNTRGRAELLRLLISGKLVARFDFPSNERPPIAVPAAYWKNDVKSGEFRKALDSKTKNKGDYVVNPNLFANEYLNWFSRDHRLPEHVDELSAALRAGSTKAEVYVSAKDWEQFTSQGLDTTQHSTEDQKSSRGKSENTNWSAVLVEVAVELLNSSRDYRPITKVIASHALERVLPRGGTQLPKVETVSKKVDEIIHRTWKSSRCLAQSAVSAN
jgi:hypothetical protein